MYLGLLLSTLALASVPASDSKTSPPVPRDPVAEKLAATLRELDRDRHTPRAIVPLAVLRDLEGELPQLAHLAVAYAAVADDHRAHPEVRALARFDLARLERRRGNLQHAAADLRRLGFLGAWQVIGPFDNEGKRGFDAAYPPEVRQDLSARYPGKAREVAWRTLPPEAFVAGFVDVGAAMRPAREVVAYALAVVDSPRTQRVHLRVGASGAVKVFVNGALAISDPAYHPPRLDQSGAAVTLVQGPNRILVKLCHDVGRLGFYARLTTPDGDAAAVSAISVPPLPAAQRSRDHAEPLESVVKALERRPPAGDEAQRHADLAVALAERRSYDTREQRAAAEARRAARLAPRSAALQLLAARLEEDDPNRRRAHLDAAFSAAPGDPVVLTALGAEELRRGRPHRAAQFFAAAASASPGYVAARAGLIQAHEQVGLGARAAVEAAELARAFPTIPAAIAAVVRAARRLDRGEEAVLALRKQLALRYDDESARGALTQILVERGDLEGALELVDAALRLDPSDVSLRLRKADLLASNGRLDEAEVAYGEAQRIVPEEPDVYERRGQARLHAGKEKDALADFQRALELKPQNPQLKELVRTITPEVERFEKPYVYDSRELARVAPTPQPDDDAVVLGDLKVTKVFPSGLSATYVQLVVKVLTQRGADAFRSQSIAYVPDRQEIHLDRARVVKPDGTSTETYQESERSASEPWYRLYYDARTRTLTFPALAPGDLLEIAYRTDDVASENLLSDYFGDLTFLEDTTRKARFDYVLLVPENRKIHANDPAVHGLEHGEKKLPGGVVEYRWSARDLPRIIPEPDMPGFSEVSPYVHVSTYADWGQVAAFYWRLVREQLQPNDEVRRTAARISDDVRRAQGRAGPPEELALVKAVYDYVVTATRYVGLEFGIHGYKPYRVDQILERRFGDCKDKASLAHALLESLGIDSRIVLLRMKRLGRIPERPASLAVFNHAILYVPKYDLWLDGTAAYSGSGDLPGEDRGATALVVNPGAAPRFGYIPEARPDQNHTETRLEVSLAPNGSARARGESRIAGTQAPEYRRAYQAEGDRRAVFEQAYSRTFPGLKVETVSLSDLSRLEDDVSLQFTLSLARYATKDGSGLSFTPFGEGHRLTETYAPLSTRRYDLVLGDPSENRFVYRTVLPGGWAASELPPPVEIDTPFAAFDARYHVDRGVLVADGRITFKVGRIRAADYPAFRSFLAQADRALARRVRVASAAAAERASR